MSSFFVTILSPSKLMNERSPEFIGEATLPQFIPQTEKLCAELKTVGVDEWKSKMKITEEIASNTRDRFQNWNKKELSKGIPAAMLFSGEAFKSLDAKSFSKLNWKQAQSSLRILSGFYGILKPTDTVLPYRLMVGTPYKTKAGKTLYSYWSETVTKQLETEIAPKGFLLNLASDEYFKLVDQKNFNRKIIHFKFLQKSGGDWKSIPTFSKQARGAMARFVIQSNPKSIEDLQAFNLEDYKFSKSQSTEDTLVFRRIPPSVETLARNGWMNKKVKSA
ncbi:MAG: peroxide stress protein YaaA [Bacteroidota bacterium]